MIFLFKKFLSLLLALMCAISFPFTGNFTAPFVSKDPKNIRLRFAAVSDIHVEDNIWRRFMLDLGLYDFENAKERLDAVVTVGDNTDHGYENQYERLYEIFNKHDVADNIIMAQGNHDAWTVPYTLDITPSKELFVKYTNLITGLGIDNVYYATSINGYRFIVMGTEVPYGDANYSGEQLLWLKGELDEAAKTGLPIFVVNHWPFNGTHSSRKWNDDIMGAQSDEIKEILNGYKNLIYICGHSHCGMTNEKTAKKYDYCSVEKVGNFTSVNVPCYMFGSNIGKRSNGTGFVFEVYDEYVLIRGRSYSASIWFDNFAFKIDLDK